MKTTTHIFALHFSNRITGGVDQNKETAKIQNNEGNEIALDI